MTDNEYASRIYCRIFRLEHTDGDLYARGVLNAINTLSEREQRTLEHYYRDGLTYKQTAEKIGLSPSQARRVVVTALLKLRHPCRSDHMRISKILEKHKV